MAPPRAGQQLVELAAQPHDGAEPAQRLHAPLAAGQAAAGGDDVVGLEPQRLHGLGFQAAEHRLAILAEDLGDGPAVAADDHVIGLHEAAPEPPRQQSADRRLPGAHEADENDVIRSHPPHRIRSCLRGC